MLPDVIEPFFIILIITHKVSIGKKKINKDMGSNKPRYNLRDIYDILYTIDMASLRKIACGKTDGLDDETKAKLSEVKKIAKELGWDQKALNKGIDGVLKNKK